MGIMVYSLLWVITVVKVFGDKACEHASRCWWRHSNVSLLSRFQSLERDTIATELPKRLRLEVDNVPGARVSKINNYVFQIACAGGQFWVSSQTLEPRVPNPCASCIPRARECPATQDPGNDLKRLHHYQMVI